MKAAHAAAITASERDGMWANLPLCGPTVTGNDSYNACIAPGVKDTLSSVGLMEMNVLGWGPKAITSTPEPGTMGLLGGSLLGMLGLRRRRK